MKRILCIVASLDTGGAETFLMKIFRKLPSDYKLDFIVSTSSGFYEDEVRSLGGQIHRIPLRTKHPAKAFRAIKQVVKDNSYKTVLKLCDTPIGVFDLWAAKAGGAEKICVRSCNSNSNDSKIKKIILNMLRPELNRIADVKIAPSTVAAEYTFGKKEIEKDTVNILHNGIDTDVYRYDENGRKAIRREFGIAEDTFVICHVGRFNKQKNHSFLIKVFVEILKKRENSKLVLVGKGEEEGNITRLVNESGIADKVVFAGIRSDVPAIMSAADVMVFPSLYEGMPNTVIEAQATGLPCIIADTITRDAKLTDFIRFESLLTEPEEWALKAISAANEYRSNAVNSILENGYDINICTREFIELT